MSPTSRATDDGVMPPSRHTDRTAVLLSDGGEVQKKRQIGPRVPTDLHDDFRWLIRHKHNGKYKGRLSEEVESAFELYMGKVITENPQWATDAQSDERYERLQQYANEYQTTAKRVSRDSEVAEELAELRQEIEAVSTTNNQMLSQILTQVSEESSG